MKAGWLLGVPTIRQLTTIRHRHQTDAFSMKIRMSGNSIRLRLSQSEVAKFHETGKVSERISFGSQPDDILTCQLERTDQSGMSATIDGNHIRVLVSSALSDTWATSEQEVGMEHLLRFPANDGHLRILVEKDFKCLADRPEEDESDNFPNPNLSC